MTMIEHSIDLRQPSEEDYLYALEKKTKLPFRIKARIINTYRRKWRGTRCELSEKSNEKGHEVTKTTRRINRLEKRYNEKPRPGPGSKHNYKVFRALKHIRVFTSGGKGRPSRKEKNLFVTYSYVVHMKGSKYTGGFRFL